MEIYLIIETKFRYFDEYNPTSSYKIIKALDNEKKAESCVLKLKQIEENLNFDERYVKNPLRIDIEYIIQSIKIQ